MVTNCKKCGKEYRLYLDALECDCEEEKTQKQKEDMNYELIEEKYFDQFFSNILQ